MAGIAAAGNVRPAIVDRVAEAILAEAEAFGADLIVLGSPRRGELATRLLGGVTLRVLRRSSCPVIVAPRQARGRRKQLARRLIVRAPRLTRTAGTRASGPMPGSLALIWPWALAYSCDRGGWQVSAPTVGGSVS